MSFDMHMVGEYFSIFIQRNRKQVVTFHAVEHFSRFNMILLVGRCKQVHFNEILNIYFCLHPLTETSWESPMAPKTAQCFWNQQWWASLYKCRITAIVCENSQLHPHIFVYFADKGNISFEFISTKIAWSLKWITDMLSIDRKGRQYYRSKINQLSMRKSEGVIAK